MLSIIPWYYKLIAGVALIAGAMWWAYGKGVDKADQKITEYENRELKLNEEIRELTTDLNEKVSVEYVDRYITIRDTTDETRKVAEDVVPDTNELSSGWVYVHDNAAEGSVPDAARSADETPSGIGANQALGTVVGNYGTCEATREQLIALQRWVRDTQAAVEQANEGIDD